MEVSDQLGEAQRAFIAKQHIFFVGSAPLAPDGRVNISPKGLDSFAVLDERHVAYIDLGGSGIETHAHLRENGRLCIMFCAFEGPANILRLYGRGRSHLVGTPAFEAARPHFPAIDGAVRGIIELEIERVQESCGWGVPRYQFVAQRPTLPEKQRRVTQAEYTQHLAAHNAHSIDGLEGFTPA